ncbi:MAG: cytochrome b [Acetobacteraceae bacterium]|nr:cytochrome b [Acetobacteraceae bacterium]MBV8523195.1 cytochrome b [Acetobacteraceae bacterium]MBV8589342.1 cytochrome b [Acetobacteraceae bacterium]
MITKPFTQATRIAAGNDRLRYDALEMSFHWATALLVVAQYLLAQAWGFLQRGTPVRLELQSLHVSLGLLLTTVLVLRILWRAGPGRRVLPATTGLVEIASKLVHYALYGLLVAVVGLGACLRWAKHDPLSFFGLFTLPSPYSFTKDQATLIGDLHNWVATTIIILAAGHAGAALFHHFFLRDDILWRMLPGKRARRAERDSPDPRIVPQEP